MFWILAFLFTAIPVAIIMAVIYYLNEHEKQPLWLLAISFVGGFLVYALVRYISGLLDGNVYELSGSSRKVFLGQNWQFFLIAFGMIAIVEELAKYIIASVLTFRSRKFQIPYDGIAYAVCVSLGFAFIENFKYLYDQGIGIAISRAIFTIPAHAAFGVVMGYYLGLAKACRINNMPNDGLKMKYIALFSPLLLHGLYDYICNFNFKQAYYILIVYTILLYILAFYKMYKFNKLNVYIYQKNVYKKDELMDDNNDDIEDEKKRIQDRLFSQADKGDWNLNHQNIQTQNLNMKMFAQDDDDFDKQNNNG